MGYSPRALVAGVRKALPEGLPLPEDIWQRRHLVVVILLWAHVVWIAVWSQILNLGMLHSMVEVGVVALFATAATTLRSNRGIASAAATMGLLASSGILVHFSGGLIEMHFHFFVMVALITLYQRWLPFLLAVGFVVVHHGTVGVLDPGGVYNHAEAIANPWKWAVIHGAFISGISIVGLASWKFNEQSRRQAGEYYQQLYEGEKGVVSRLAEADRLKEELIDIISHELRTPLTSIMGFSGVLLTKRDALTPEETKEMLESIQRQGKVLSGLVENFLDTSRAMTPDLSAMCHVATLCQQVVKEVRQVSPRAPEIQIEADESLQVQMASGAFALVLSNLITNAVKFSPKEGSILLRAEDVGEEVRLSITNPLVEPIEEGDLERLFEPFFQIDSTNTRKAGGVGLGLHIVKRLVQAYGGTVTIQTTNKQIVFGIALPSARFETAEPELATGSEKPALTS